MAEKKANPEERVEEDGKFAGGESPADSAAADTPDEEAATPASELSPEELVARLEAAEAKAAENWDQFLRAKAEIENLRRRAERDLENAHKYALDRIVQELLPVIDSMELGLAAAEAEGATVEKLKEGTELTLKMFLAALEKFGISQVNPEGERFDPEFHQAMTTQPVSHVEPNTVLNVFQKGYLLNDRLIRPAMVVVSASEDQAPGAKVDEHA
ncbi:MAG: nucleotide exchange factor GrpE [Gammaproteobacteria bacterium]